MEHAAQWVASEPELEPYKHQWGGDRTAFGLYGCSVVMGFLFVLTCIVVGLIAMARVVI